MYLKEIKMIGFKSFAERTIIEFEKGITGVVGPNGSGKSNIVDAVKWVLGEQSIKSLRGDDKMTDIIFSGSKSRKPLNMASVTLLFDNSDKHLPISYEEVSIKRTIYASGENEYYLNNEKCRLKDITDLLLDSGSSKEAFNIISQGKIQEILSNRPEDRRIIFEEAAGVLKYKKRKEEAIRKLDRTHDNMTRIKDIIQELEINIEPLKEQSKKAIKYVDYKKELEEIEIALITNDIEQMNYDYQEAQKKLEEINNEIISLKTSSSKEGAILETKKLELQKLENRLQDLNSKLLKIVTEVEQLNSEKKIIIERQKYQVDNQKLHTNLVLLKEQELKLKNSILNIENELKSNQEELDNVIEQLEYEQKVSIKIKEQVDNFKSKINLKIKEQSISSYNIDRLNESIENNSEMSHSVRCVLSNPKLNGVYNVIGKLLDTEEKYAVALDIALGGSKEFVVVDNEKTAKDAVAFLKNNNYGRATFLPVSIINSRSIDQSVLNDIKNIEGFIDIASNLIKYDEKFANIMLNQLATILVVKDLTVANEISKKINYRYKVVSLEGDLIHIGGSITGGSLKKKPGMIKEKYELEKLIKDHKIIKEDIVKLEKELNEINEKYNIQEIKTNDIFKNKISLIELNSSKEKIKNSLNVELTSVLNELNGTDNTINDSLSEEEIRIMNQFYEKEKEKNLVSKEIEDIIKNKKHLQEEINLSEEYLRKENSNNSKKFDILKELEIQISRMDIKLDTLLNRLSEEYNLTFEHAKEIYKLEIEEKIARSKVNALKNDIKNLGNVNIGSIEEYERINKRYTFLSSQKDDLENAEMTLLEIIKEMDEIMEDEFSITFNLIKERFKETFSKLFGGGTASLKMTNPDNILETGIEIIASPPGKKLTTISLLSGGEKTLTAIALLFAILKECPVPYCLLDEIEAALDEVNVDKFGQYLETFKSKTQFIIITHKKKTMEYVDSLYGITMPEAGVSKLVSVRLEDIKKEAK